MWVGVRGAGIHGGWIVGGSHGCWNVSRRHERLGCG